MKKKVRLIAALLAFAVVCSWGVQPAVASASEQTPEVVTYIDGGSTYDSIAQSVSPLLSISSTGTATATTLAVGSKDTYKIEIRMHLERYSGGEWTSIQRWTTEKESSVASLSKTAKVTKGYKYRVRSVCFFYAEGMGEGFTTYSTAETY